MWKFAAILHDRMIFVKFFCPDLKNFVTLRQALFEPISLIY